MNILSDKLYKDNADECSFILGSDFNVVRDKNLDYMGQSSLKKQSKVSIELEDFMNRFRMIDIWRSKHKDKKHTYKQGNPFMQSRLDYWLISDNLGQIVSRCEIIPSIAPDHSAVNLYLYNKPTVKSHKYSNYWKFNNSLLKDSEYVMSMKEEILNLKDKTFFGDNR